jgi:hypothetical protein
MIKPKQGTKQRVPQQLLFVVNHLAAACQRFAYSRVWSGRVVLDQPRSRARSHREDIALVARKIMNQPAGPTSERQGVGEKLRSLAISTSLPHFAVRLFKFSALVRSTSVADMPRHDSAVAARRGMRSGRWSGARQLFARILGLPTEFRPIRKARAHALDHSFESREQFLPLFVESLLVPQRDYHFEAFDDFFRVLLELFCFIKHFAHPRFCFRGRRLSGCLLVSQDHPYCDFKIKIIKWLIALLGGVGPQTRSRTGRRDSAVAVQRGRGCAGQSADSPVPTSEIPKLSLVWGH